MPEQPDDIDFKAIFAALPDKPLLRVDEVAVFIGVSRQTVYSWYPSTLKGTNLNGTIRIFRQSVIEMVTANIGRENGIENITEVEEKLTKESRLQAKGTPKGSGWVKRW